MPIVVAGTLNKKLLRQSAGKWEWDDALAIAQVKWDGEDMADFISLSPGRCLPGYASVG
jgi:hypothetical protein